MTILATESQISRQTAYIEKTSEDEFLPVSLCGQNLPYYYELLCKFGWKTTHARLCTCKGNILQAGGLVSALYHVRIDISPQSILITIALCKLSEMVQTFQGQYIVQRRYDAHRRTGAYLMKRDRTCCSLILTCLLAHGARISGPALMGCHSMTKASMLYVDGPFPLSSAFQQGVSIDAIYAAQHGFEVVDRALNVTP